MYLISLGQINAYLQFVKTLWGWGKRERERERERARQREEETK